ncbi:MAG: DUF1211 domain-containing protein [Chitinophagaceae bacterium]|nr:MAG: DUF1211 domain-containing protein [Chitinophagaceae bacterium]
MKVATTRLEAFSDGVIAIIITVMVLQFRLPDLSGADSSSGEILRHLKGELPYLGAYAFSFMIIGISWTNHHHMFHLLEHTDATLLWFNFLLLFFMSLIPYGTGIVSANPHLPVGLSLYAGILACQAGSFLLMRHYSLAQHLRHHDPDKKLDREIHRVSHRARRKSLIGMTLYAGAALLAWVNVWVAYACLLIPPVIFFLPEGIDQEELAEKVAEKNG